MKLKLPGKPWNHRFPLIFLLAFGFCFAGCVTYKPSMVVVKRAGTALDDGKLYVYVDKKLINEKEPVGKGQSRSLPVSNGFHRIWVRVDNLESGEKQFTAENNSVTFKVSVERVGGSKVIILERDD
jgi:hypothetical protein